MAAVAKALEGIEAQIVKAGIHYKINQIMEEVGVIKKMRSEGVKYAYQAWDDVVPALNEALVKFGVTLTFTETPPIFQALQVGKTEVIVGMTIRATDSESGDFTEVTKYGAATYYNPQAYQAAGTYAYKYAMLKMFLIPCKEDQDPDSIPEQKAQLVKQESAKPQPKQAKPEEKSYWERFVEKSGEPTDFQKNAVKGAAKDGDKVNTKKLSDIMQDALDSDLDWESLTEKLVSGNAGASKS